MNLRKHRKWLYENINLSVPYLFFSRRPEIPLLSDICGFVNVYRLIIYSETPHLELSNSYRPRIHCRSVLCGRTSKICRFLPFIKPNKESKYLLFENQELKARQTCLARSFGALPWKCWILDKKIHGLYFRFCRTHEFSSPMRQIIFCKH